MQQLIILDDNDITRLLPRTDVRAALERMFIALAEGQAVQPPQTLGLFPADGGDFTPIRESSEAMASSAPNCRLIFPARTGRRSPPGHS